jgi:hypothetical protein
MSNVGDIDWPKFKAFALINALGGDFEYTQSQVHEVADDPGFSAQTPLSGLSDANATLSGVAQKQGEG